MIHQPEDDLNRRVLIVDDNRAIQNDFRKILCPVSQGDTALAAAEAALFGESADTSGSPSYELDFASQGDEALGMIERARESGRPYALVFIDVRMPPGRDGIETTAALWAIDPEVEVVVCTAYADYSWREMRDKVGSSERLMVLKKPFDSIEVLQLADMLTRRWWRTRAGQQRVATLERVIAERTGDLSVARQHLECVKLELARAHRHERSAMNTQARLRAGLIEDLRHAIANGDIHVHYQPLVEIATRRPLGLEALARWKHREQGVISPAAFIPLAEETGLIVELGEHVLRMVCAEVVRWQREGVPVVPVSINVSAVQLQRQSMLELVRTVLRETGMAPELLVIEVTESALMENLSRHVAELGALRAEGVGIEIDDFGTGYSSLSYLKQLPIDTLKIDRSFIRNIDASPVDASIVGAVIALAKTLNLRVVAEGVETLQQLQVLAGQGCEFAQGFFFSRPLPAQRCRQLLKELDVRSSFTETLRIELASRRAIV